MAHDVLKLLDELSPEVRRAFVNSLNSIKSEAQIGVIIAALRRGDFDSAVAAMNIRSEFFSLLDEALAAAYLRGGVDAIAGLPRIPNPFPQGALWPDLMVVILAQKLGSETRRLG